RQRGAYREAVRDLSEGRVAEGFSKLDGMGSIKELEPTERLGHMADDYARAATDGKSVLAISPTHAEGERVSLLIRERLRERGLIEQREYERHVESLTGLGWTEAQRSDARHYEPGMLVQFHRHAKGFKIGDRAKVV